MLIIAVFSCLYTVKLPRIVKSPEISILRLNDASPLTNNLELNDTSPVVTDNGPTNDGANTFASNAFTEASNAVDLNSNLFTETSRARSCSISALTDAFTAALVEPNPIIAVYGIDASGYCAYKLPQMSTRPLNDASPFTYSLLFKAASFEATNLPFIVKSPEISILRLNDASPLTNK